MKKKTLLFTFSMVIIFSNILFAMETGEKIDKEFNVKSGGTELYIRVRG